MISVKDKATGKFLGNISEEELAFLIDQLEEEYEKDQDYWLHRIQIEAFKENDADPHLIKLLEDALGENDEMEIIWERF
jgi:hypothetical protein